MSVWYELEGVEFPWLTAAAVVASLKHPVQKAMRECEWVLSGVQMVAVAVVAVAVDHAVCCVEGVDRSLYVRCENLVVQREEGGDGVHGIHNSKAEAEVVEAVALRADVVLQANDAAATEVVGRRASFLWFAPARRTSFIRPQVSTNVFLPMTRTRQETQSRVLLFCSKGKAFLDLQLHVGGRAGQVCTVRFDVHLHEVLCTSIEAPISSLLVFCRQSTSPSPFHGSVFPRRCARTCGGGAFLARSSRA